MENGDGCFEKKECTQLGKGKELTRRVFATGNAALEERKINTSNVCAFLICPS